MLVSYPIIEISFSIFCTLFSIYTLEHILCMCVCAPAIVLSMGTTFVNKEEIVSGTHSDDSVTLRLSSLRVFNINVQ